MAAYCDWNIFDMENALKKGTLIYYLEYLFNNGDENKIIEVLKVSGYFISYMEFFEREDEGCKAIEKFIEYKMSKKSNNSIMRLRKEAGYLENKRNFISRKLDEILHDYNVDLYLLARSSVELLDDIQEKYDVEMLQQIISTNEYVVYSLGSIIKELFRLKESEYKPKKEINDKGLRDIFNLANTLREFNEVIQAWMFGEVSICVDIDGLFASEECNFFSKNKQRILSGMSFFDVKDAIQYKAAFKKEQGCNETEIYEACLKNKVKEYFYTEDFSEKYLGIELEKWVEMYLFFYKLACKEKDNTYCIIIKSELVSELQQLGMSDDIVNKMLKLITFTKFSKDLFDSFLISVQETYIFIPKIYLVIDASRAMMSMFGKKEKGNIGQKGIAFEKYIASLVQKNKNIRIAKNVKGSEGNEKYEIDLILILDNEAFFCECKTQYQHEDMRGYYRNLYELGHYIEKFKRNYLFFNENEKGKELLKNHLLHLGIDINGITKKHKLYISNICYPIEKYDDIYVVDEISIYRYMNRIPACVYVLNGTEKVLEIYKMFPCLYEGIPSAKQFKEYLENKKREVEIEEKRIKLWKNETITNMGISFERYIIDYSNNYLQELNPNEYILNTEQEL